MTQHATEPTCNVAKERPQQSSPAAGVENLAVARLHAPQHLSEGLGRGIVQALQALVE